MSTRTNFDAKLKALKQNLIKMGELSIERIDEAMEALKNQDLEKASKLIEMDNEINRLNDKINDEAITLIAREAPVATDLRRIIAAINISSDVERIGDLAVNIAKSTLMIGANSLIKPIIDIPKMAEIVKEMLSDSLQAFLNNDIILAKQVAEKDDEVDQMYGRLVKELMELMAQKPEYIDQVLQLSFICRHLERVGDHTTNIVEQTIYKVKGERFDLNT